MLNIQYGVLLAEKKERFREERDRKRVLTPLMVQNIQYGVLPAEKERGIERNEVQRKERGRRKKKRERGWK